jgi:hypothetical protein
MWMDIHTTKNGVTGVLSNKKNQRKRELFLERFEGLGRRQEPPPGEIHTLV